MDRIIERLITLIESSVKTPRGLKRVYNGHPMDIPNSSVPACIVRGVSMRSETLDTRRNQEIFGLQIIIIDEARNRMNKELEESTVEREVRKIFEERDTNNELRSDTIMSVVEKEFMYDENYNINIVIDDIVFGAGLDPVFTTRFPGGFYGIMSLTVRSIPHNIKTP